MPAFFIPEGTPVPEGGWPAPDGWGGPLDPVCEIGDGDGTETTGDGDGDGDGDGETGSTAFGDETGAFDETGGDGDGDGDGDIPPAGEYTCSCLSLPPPQTPDQEDIEVIDFETELVGTQCCFNWTYNYTGTNDGCGGVAGRPFLVSGEAQRAAIERRRDWCELDFDVGPLPASAREAIARAWLEDARMEHASVPAFSRHLLQLIALGAPPDLVSDTQRAIGDEIEHTKACFGLARAYSRESLGPARFELAHAEISYDLLEVVREVLIEGCVGETVAAMAAQVSASRATVPAVKQVLEKIAADELEHSLLGFRFVSWAKEQDPAGVRELLDEALASLPVDAAKDVEQLEDTSGFPEHGRLSEREGAEIRARAITHVVIPLLQAMRVDEQQVVLETHPTL